MYIIFTNVIIYERKYDQIYNENQSTDTQQNQYS
jgi:hypothetical protein